MGKRGIRKSDVIVTAVILVVLYVIGIYNAVTSNFTTDLSTMKEEEYKPGKYVEADIALNLGSYAQEESYRFRFIKTGTADYYVVSTSPEAKDFISLKTNKDTKGWEDMADKTTAYMADNKQAPEVKHIKGQLRKCESKVKEYLDDFMEGSEALGITYSGYYIQQTDAIDAYAVLIAAIVVTLVMGLRFFLMSRSFQNRQTEQEIPPEE